jgi:CheY-like chemotaxis protein
MASATLNAVHSAFRLGNVSWRVALGSKVTAEVFSVFRQWPLDVLFGIAHTKFDGGMVGPAGDTQHFPRQQVAKKNLDIEVRVAHDGAGALKLAAGYRPEMIFLVIGMPGLDGYEAARRLRQQPGLENIRLAALTGWGQLMIAAARPKQALSTTMSGRNCRGRAD